MEQPLGATVAWQHRGRCGIIQLMTAFRPTALFPLLLLSGLLHAQEAAKPAAPKPQPKQAKARARQAAEFPAHPRVVWLGHSLLSDIPDMVVALARATKGLDMTFKEHNIPGAPLRWQWDEETRGGKTYEPQFGMNANKAIKTGEYDTLVMVDSVPRGGRQMMDETIDYAGRYLELVRKHRPEDGRTFFYEPWHCTDTGTPKGCPYDKDNPNSRLTWRERLDADAKMWAEIVDAVNKAHPGGVPLRMVPVGSALGRLADAIAAGEVPGFKGFRDLFQDDIHLNPTGKYFVACVHYATLYGRSPEGLPQAVVSRWGKTWWGVELWDKSRWEVPDPKAVKVMQRIAWETVAGHPLTGVPAAKGTSQPKR